MIYTLTLNPAIDYFITLNSSLMIDEVNRGSNDLFKAAGKGLNVSKVLSKMSIKSKAIALLGGFTGNYIKECFEKDENIEIISIPVNGNNRINMKAHYDSKALCINGEGPKADQGVKDKLIEQLRLIDKDDLVVVSGSMMKGFDKDFILAIASILNEKGAKMVLDMEQADKRLLAACKPFLIKPNLYELTLLLEDESITSANLISHVDEIRSLNVENVLISLGKDGACLVTTDQVIWLRQPNTVLVNKVGAGDAMLAAFIGKLSENNNKQEALRYAGAAGNATASKLEDIQMEDIESFLPLMSTEIENS